MTREPDRPRYLADRLIREATEAGEFDNVPGAGRPIAGLEETYRPDWWAKAWAKRELEDPRLLALEEGISVELEDLRELLNEMEVRRRLEELNQLISAAPDGAGFASIDVEAAIKTWRRGEPIRWQARG